MAKWESIDELFSGRHFDREIIILCVRWYLRFKLSFRDLVEMMAERGIVFSHTTVMRWVHELMSRTIADQIGTLLQQAWLDPDDLEIEHRA